MLGGAVEVTHFLEKSHGELNPNRLGYGDPITMVILFWVNYNDPDATEP